MAGIKVSELLLIIGFAMLCSTAMAVVAKQPVFALMSCVVTLVFCIIGGYQYSQGAEKQTTINI